MPVQAFENGVSWDYRTCKGTASEIKKWRQQLEKNIRRESKQGIMWSIEDARLLGLKEDHPDVMAARSALASLPNGEGSHPSRTELTGVEPMCARWAEGALAKAMVYGDAQEFENTMGQFIELMELESPPTYDRPKNKGLSLNSGRSSCSSGSTSDKIREHGASHGHESKLDPSTVIADLWAAADINGDHQLSQPEARETLRVFLSRPQLRQTLGEPLKAVIAHRMADDPIFAEEVDLRDPLADCLSYMVHGRVLRLCKHAVSKSCLDVAKHLPEMTDSFWAAMDLNENGTVDENEFLRSFEHAIRKVVIPPLWARAEDRAWKMVKAGCWNATTTEQMDELLKTHIKQEKFKKKTELMDEILQTQIKQKKSKVSKLPSATDEAGEFCKAGDCTVM